MIKEACTGNYVESINAEKQGATRIELCENLHEGGTTPSYGTTKILLNELSIPILVMIRPRGGDFTYSESEIEIMLEDIKLFKDLGVKGFVFGVLTDNNEIDYPLLEKLIEPIKGLDITFHKAIDELDDPIKEVKKLSQLGVTRILSSGTRTKALDGENILNAMIKECDENIRIVVAGGVTDENFEEVSSRIKSSDYHGKKIVGNLN